MVTLRCRGDEIHPLNVPKSLMNPAGCARGLILPTAPLEIRLAPDGCWIQLAPLLGSIRGCEGGQWHSELK